MYDMLVPQLIRVLNNAKGFIQEAESHAEANKFKVDVLLSDRLYPDQFNFTRQIQILSDNAKAIGARLTGVTNPTMADDETTAEELYARLDKTIAFLNTLTPEHFEGWEERQARFPWLPGKHMEGQAYIFEFALPNLYFHLTTAYSILRHNGVKLGKVNYMGHITFQDD